MEIYIMLMNQKLNIIKRSVISESAYAFNTI